MSRTVMIVVAVLVFALQCAVASPVAEDDISTHSTPTTDLPSEPSDNVTSTTSSLPDETTATSSTTVTPSPSNGASGAGNSILFAQVFAIALVTRLLVL